MSGLFPDISGYGAVVVLSQVPTGGQLVPVLILAHWFVDLGPGVSSCRTLRIPVLVPLHWCLGLDPGSSGEQGLVHWCHGLRQS